MKGILIKPKYTLIKTDRTLENLGTVFTKGKLYKAKPHKKCPSLYEITNDSGYLALISPAEFEVAND
jgi:hypothetical protein